MDRGAFQVAGFRITVDPLLPLVLFLVAWLLAERYFPEVLVGLDPQTYWVMGVVASLFLTISILLHEFGHAITARRFNLSIVRIHLFLFGGMAELKQRPAYPAQEYYIALAGPLTSLLFAGLFYLALSFQLGLPPEATLVMRYICYMNLMLGLFNLLPIFPLDGGRALRAWFWKLKGGFHSASVLIFRVSALWIVLFFVLAAISLFYFDYNLTLILGLTAIYLGYTALSGRRELTHMPTFEELVYPVANNHSLSELIEEIATVDRHYLKRCVFPVVNGHSFDYVIDGRDLVSRKGFHDDLSSYYRPIHAGDYIDIQKTETYDYSIQFKADYIPVLNNGNLLGLCDGHEMQFWLLEKNENLIASVAVEGPLDPDASAPASSSSACPASSGSFDPGASHSGQSRATSSSWKKQDNGTHEQ